MATAPNVPNFEQWNFELNDTDEVLIKDNARNAALKQFGDSLTAMTESINTDLQTMEQQKTDTQQAAQAASDDAEQIALDKQAVADDRTHVDQQKGIVDTKTQQVSTAAQQVATDRQAVADDRLASEQAAGASSAAATASIQAKNDAQALYGDLAAVDTAKTEAQQAATTAGEESGLAVQARQGAEQALTDTQAVRDGVQQTVDQAITAHEAEADPHEQYLNQERGDDRYLMAGRNLLTNAKFRINQREYVSGTPTGTIAVNKFTLDRWYVDVNGEAVTFVASGSGNQVTAPAGGMSQVVEGADIEGGEYTLSWIGDATAEVNAVPVAKGGQLTLPANMDAKVSFIGGTVEEAQLEKGSIATPFEHRPIGWELALCKRFYEEGVVYIYVSTSSRLGGSVQFGTTKRAQPVIEYFNRSGVFINPGLESIETSGSLSSFRFVTPSGLSSNVYVGSFSWTADAEIII